MRQTEQPGRWDDYDEWIDYYEANGIEAIGFGLITMRKRADGAPWFRADEATQDFAMPCGDQLGAVFELADLLATHTDDDLLGVALGVAPGVVLDERLGPTADGWASLNRRLRQTTGLCFEGEVDPAVAAIVGACDGTRPLADVLAASPTARASDSARSRRRRCRSCAACSSRRSSCPPRTSDQTFGHEPAFLALTSKSADTGGSSLPDGLCGE